MHVTLISSQGLVTSVTEIVGYYVLIRSIPIPIHLHILGTGNVFAKARVDEEIINENSNRGQCRIKDV